MARLYYVERAPIVSHSGIKGMKWGQRRYQNRDGSLTQLGRLRYGYSLRPKEAKPGLEDTLLNPRNRKGADSTGRGNFDDYVTYLTGYRYSRIPNDLSKLLGFERKKGERPYGFDTKPDDNSDSVNRYRVGPRAEFDSNPYLDTMRMKRLFDKTRRDLYDDFIREHEHPAAKKEREEKERRNAEYIETHRNDPLSEYDRLIGRTDPDKQKRIDDFNTSYDFSYNKPVRKASSFDLYGRGVVANTPDLVSDFKAVSSKFAKSEAVSKFASSTFGNAAYMGAKLSDMANGYEFQRKVDKATGYVGSKSNDSLSRLLGFEYNPEPVDRTPSLSNNQSALGRWEEFNRRNGIY